MFFAFALLAFKFHIVFSVALQNPVASSHPTSAIRTLFAVPGREQLVYPPLDVKGPKPRAAWVEAYRRVKLAGLIPQNSSIDPLPKSSNMYLIPQNSTKVPQESAGLQKSVNGAESSEHANPGLKESGKIIRTPPGTVGLCFDDGPHAASRELLTYLTAQSQAATHFLIGTQILRELAIFKALDLAGQHHAVHTYSHPVMPWLTDEEIVGEIGWTMQLIHDYTSGQKIAKYWRPPYGKTNARVQAIATHVFGLETVMWQYDTADWCLADHGPAWCAKGKGPQNIHELEAILEKIIHSPKNDGLLILEHELSFGAVVGFEHIFPVMKRLGWRPKPIPDLFNETWYQA